MSIEVWTLLLLGLVVFVTHGLEAITGFGCTVLAFPLVLAVTGEMDYTRVVLTVMGWLLALYFVITKFGKINWRQFLIIAGVALAGLPAGIWLYDVIDGAILKKVLGGFIVITASVQLWKIFAARGDGEGRFNPLNYLCLFGGGVVHGAFATGGPLIVLYSARRLPDKGEFRATMCLLWTTLNLGLMWRFFSGGLLTPQIGRDVLLLVPALVLGVIAGEKIHKKVNAAVFKKLVFSTLLAIGAIMIFL
jgi:uncharacterized membrane protein YfcA